MFMYSCSEQFTFQIESQNRKYEYVFLATYRDADATV